jgi:hypothetical protein
MLNADDDRAADRVGCVKAFTQLAGTHVGDRRAGHVGGRSGFNLAIEHHPELIIEATAVADVVAAVRLATREGRSVLQQGAVVARTAVVLLPGLLDEAGRR